MAPESKKRSTMTINNVEITSSRLTMPNLMRLGLSEEKASRCIEDLLRQGFERLPAGYGVYNPDLHKKTEPEVQEVRHEASKIAEFRAKLSVATNVESEKAAVQAVIDEANKAVKEMADASVGVINPDEDRFYLELNTRGSTGGFAVVCPTAKKSVLLSMAWPDHTSEEWTKNATERVDAACVEVLEKMLLAVMRS